jgi:putative DNA primase/helicase
VADDPSERGSLERPSDEGLRARVAAALIRQSAATAKPVEPEELLLDPKAPHAAAALLYEAAWTSNGERTLRFYDGAYHEWMGSRFAPIEAHAVIARLYELSGRARLLGDGRRKQPMPFNPTRSKIADIDHALQSLAFLPSSIQPPAWLEETVDLEPLDILPCQNCLLHLPTRSALPHTPLFFNTAAIGCSYEPSASAPSSWLKFLADSFSGDGQRISALQEIFGYMLTPDVSQQKIFMLLGPPRSGKGTIARVLTALIGRESVAAPTLANIAANFGLAPLIGKTLAIIGDARLGARTDQHEIAERLLSLSGEDSLDIDRKFLLAWTGKLLVRFLLITNELPAIADASGALSSRFVIVTLTRSFLGSEDTSLTSRLLTELPGILNWAIEGRERLMRRGHFVQPSASTDAALELQDLGSPIRAFIRDECTVGAGAEIGASTLFEAWCAWCRKQGRSKTGTVQVFGRNLRAAIPGLSITQPREGENRDRVYRGISLR